MAGRISSAIEKGSSDMAKRPVFIPSPNGDCSVVGVPVEFTWFAGLSKQQKQRSIASLHSRAKEDRGLGRLLEISSKSPEPAGVALSAFNLIGRRIPEFPAPVEVQFQSAKVFSDGGPYLDLLRRSPKDAKRDSRLKSSGGLRSFQIGATQWPIVPRTAFYDWIYINALLDNPKLAGEVEKYDGFTDIEFNPAKSINCQAASAALYVALVRAGKLTEALNGKEKFLSIMSASLKGPEPRQEELF